MNKDYEKAVAEAETKYFQSFQPKPGLGSPRPDRDALRADLMLVYARGQYHLLKEIRDLARGKADS
jgi:hypothetical protein